MENQIIHGDCFDYLSQFPDSSFDAIITDPPYGINLAKWDNKINVSNFTIEVKRLLEDGFYCFFGQMPTMVEWINHSISENFIYREHISWFKRVTSPSYNLGRTFENIFIFSKGKMKFYSVKGRYEDIKLSFVGIEMVDFLDGIDRYIKDLRNTVKTGKINFIWSDKSQLEYKRFGWRKYPRSPEYVNYTNAWSFLPPSFAIKNGVENKNHPTEKPLELIKRLIELTTKENDLILDPFAGSGTLAIACLETNRRYICIEKEKEYFDIMQSRINQWHNNKLNSTGTHNLPEGVERINQDNSGQLSLF